MTSLSSEEGLETTFQEIQKGLKAERDPRNAISGFLEIFPLVSERLDLESIFHSLSKSLDTILNRSPSPDTTEMILDFLQKTTEFCCQFIHVPVVTACIGSLFDPQRKFYDYADQIPSDHQFLHIQPTDLPSYSSHVLVHFDIFLAKDGPEKILQRFQQHKPKLTFEEILVYLRLFDKIFAVSPDEKKLSLVDHFWTDSTALILSMTSEELKTDEANKRISSILTYLNKILERTYPPHLYATKAKYTFELFSLQMALQWLQLPILQKRIQGLSDLNRACDSKTNAINSKELVDWLEQKNVVSYLFGESSHQELMKRSGPVLKLFASLNRLSPADIDLIWNSGMGKHESVVHMIWELLGSISGHLSIDFLSYILQKIQTIPPSSYDPQLVEFIGNLIENGIKRDVRFTEYGLAFCWRNILDAVGHTSLISNYMMTVFGKILSAPSCEIYLSLYLEFCLNNIETKVSVPRSLQVMTHIFSLVKNDHEVRSWCKSVHLVDSITDCIRAYASYAREQAKEISPSVDPKDFCFAGNESHLVWLKLVLNSLQHILFQSQEPFTEEQIDCLWDALIFQALSERIQDEGFIWFISVFATCKKIRLSSGTQYLFEKFCKINFQHLTLQAFDFFDFFFRNLNYIERKYEEVGDEIRWCSFDLTGIDCLWRIIVESINEKVGEAAISFITKLSKNYHPDLKEEITAYHEKFVSECFSFLMNSARSLQRGEGDKAIHQRTIVRCLGALSNLLFVFRRESSTLKFHGQVPNMFKYTIIRIGAPVGTPQPSLEVDRNETVRTFHRKIAEVMEVDPYSFRIMLAKPFCYDGRISDVPFQGDKMYLAMNRPPPPEADEAFTLPHHIMIQDVHFDQFFELLNILPPNLAPQVWDILLKLPTNQSIEMKLKGINETTNWESFLDCHNVYRLYYSLQIIDSIINFSEVNESQNWSKLFLQYGGLKFLISTFGKTDFVQGSCLKGTICLSLLLKHLNYFIKLGQSGSRTETLQRLQLNPISFIDQLMTIVEGVSKAQINQGSLNEKSEDEVGQPAMALLIWVVENDPSTLLKNTRLSSWLENVLLRTPSKKIRQTVKDGLGQISKNRIETVEALLHNLIEILALCNDSKFIRTASEYFDLLQLLLDTKSRATGGNFVSFMNQVVQMISDRPIYELHSSSPEDQILLGLLNVSHVLINVFPELKTKFGPVLLDQVFDQCLFDVPTNGFKGIVPPRCKSPASRAQAYYLLNALTSGSPQNITKFCTKAMEKLHNNQQKLAPWGYQPSDHDKSPVGYVGLKNQGATCYMNSLFQQLFMQPHFRQRLLSVEDTEPKKSESFLHQLQTIFVNLEESSMMYYDTLPFCSIYNKDGTPMKFHEQMDVDEFLSIFFDRLEGLLKGTPQEKMLDELYGGEVVNQIISSECEHTIERKETFLTLGVEVKNKASIDQSLDLFVQEDLLEGDNKYHCEKCNKKVTARKRCCINKLPQNLIVHLKRFDFDIEILRRSKLNTYCEFPMRLNVEPYTKEGLSRKEQATQGMDTEPVNFEEYEYILSGILVHTGTTESGHYYSYVRDRETGKWIIFNDSHVSPLNPETIGKECFGGYFNVVDPQTGKPSSRTYARENNAYMLFYEKVIPEKPLSPILHQPIPRDIFEEVWAKNFAFLIEKNVFDKQYLNFILNLLSNAVIHEKVEMPISDKMDEDGKPNGEIPMIKKTAFDDSTTLKIAELSMTVFVKVVAHFVDKDLIMKFAHHFKSLLSIHFPSCEWFLEALSTSDWIRNLLARCPTNFIAIEFRKLVTFAVDSYLRSYAPSEPSAQQDTIEFDINIQEAPLGDVSDLLYSPKEDTVLSRFIYSLIKRTESIYIVWRFFENFWALIEELTAIKNWHLTELFVSIGYIRALVHLYLRTDSPWFTGKDTRKKKSEGDAKIIANMKPALGAISNLIQRCSFESKNVRSRTNLLPFPTEDKEFISKQAIERFIFDDVNTEAMVDLVKHICTENMTNSNLIATIIGTGIVEKNNQFIPMLFPYFKALLHIEDSLTKARIVFTLEAFMNAFKVNYEYPQCLAACLIELQSDIKITLVKDLLSTKYLDALIHCLFVDKDPKSTKLFFTTRLNAELLLLDLLPEFQGYQIYDHAKSNLLTPTSFSLESPPAITDSSYEILSEMLAYILAEFGLSRTKNDLVRLPGDEKDYPEWEFKLLSSLRLLCWIISKGIETGTTFVEDVLLEADNLEKLIALFQLINETKCHQDQNRLYYVGVISRLFSGFPKIAKHAASSEDTKKLWCCYVSLSAANGKFNAQLLDAFYRMMYALSAADQTFLEASIKESNFWWAIRYVLLGDYLEFWPIHSDNADFVETYLQLAFERSTDFQKQLPSKFFEFAHHDKKKFKCEGTHWQRIFRLCQLILASEASRAQFYLSKGFLFLAKIFHTVEEWDREHLHQYCKILEYALKNAPLLPTKPPSTVDHVLNVSQIDFASLTDISNQLLFFIEAASVSSEITESMFNAILLIAKFIPKTLPPVLATIHKLLDVLDQTSLKDSPSLTGFISFALNSANLASTLCESEPLDEIVCSIGIACISCGLEPNYLNATLSLVTEEVSSSVSFIKLLQMMVFYASHPSMDDQDLRDTLLKCFSAVKDDPEIKSSLQDQLTSFSELFDEQSLGDSPKTFPPTKLLQLFLQLFHESGMDPTSVPSPSVEGMRTFIQLQNDPSLQSAFDAFFKS